jgi:hypothetical protein
VSSISDRLAHAWNQFKHPQSFQPIIGTPSYTPSTYVYRPISNERSVVSALYNRIAMDVSSIDIKHCVVDKETGGYLREYNSGLNNCLKLSANVDQTGRALIQELVLTMFDEGCAALVPIDTNVNPRAHDSFDILTMRVGKIVEWYPNDVKIEAYNDRTGTRDEIILPKTKVAIVQNPLYTVMNEPNSTLQRLIKKLSLLDVVDEQSGSGKLDLIIQLPYTIRSDARKKQAEDRRKSIEEQLSNSKYGIAYADATERITQLNRSVENNLLSQIQYLTTMLYGQLGVSEAVANGTASEEEMIGYNNRTLEPILTAICDSLTRTFLTKTARTQGQVIRFFRDPFKLTRVQDLADVAQKFIAMEVLSSNEVRSILFRKQSDDPNANALRNPNINTADSMASEEGAYVEGEEEGYGGEGGGFGDTPVSEL